jgi:hypothetical protein
MHQLQKLHQSGCWKLGKLVGREGLLGVGAGVGAGADGAGPLAGEEPVAALSRLDMALSRYLRRARTRLRSAAASSHLPPSPPQRHAWPH